MKYLKYMRGFAPILLILAVVILAALAGGTYLLIKPNLNSNKSVVTEIKSSPSVIASSMVSTVDTSNWKTYINNDYNFSFKYPNRFTLKVTKLNENTTDFDGNRIPITFYELSFSTNTLISNGSERDNDWSGFTIRVAPTSGKTILQEYENRRLYGGDILTKVNLLAQSANADEVAEISNYAAVITYRKGNYFFDIDRFTNSLILPDRSDDVTVYLDQILSTFKFIDQMSPAPSVSCLPRPACLDATPRCLIAEPANGWCK